MGHLSHLRVYYASLYAPRVYYASLYAPRVYYRHTVHTSGCTTDTPFIPPGV